MEENYIWPKITKYTTLEEVREIHRRIWDYAIEHGEKPETPYKLNCVLCEYAYMQSQYVIWCRACPADWGEPTCARRGSPYYLWAHAENDPELKSFFAKNIRDVPFKEE